MTLSVDVLAKTVLSARRQGLFRKKSMFEPYETVTATSVDALENKIRNPLPTDLRSWLITLGYGDINEQLSFRENWFAIIDSGQLKGGAQFAQDILGNFYAFDSSGAIYFLSRSEPAFTRMSQGFLEFIEELIRREYKLSNWVSTLETRRYDW